MAKIISIHSFRGGTGKSNIAANLATLLALEGYRVGVVDTDIQSPGIHVPFGIATAEVTWSLNDYLWGKCPIHAAAIDVSARLQKAPAGNIYLVPSSVKTDDISRVLEEGFEPRVVTNGLRVLLNHLNLDILVIDTHPGLNQETMLSIAISHTLLIVMRPDLQDYEGTDITLEVAGALHVPRMLLLVNKVPRAFDNDAVRQNIRDTFGCEIGGILHHSEKMMMLSSRNVFALEYPDHPITQTLKQLALDIVAYD